MVLSLLQVPLARRVAPLVLALLYGLGSGLTGQEPSESHERGLCGELRGRTGTAPGICLGLVLAEGPAIVCLSDRGFVGSHCVSLRYRKLTPYLWAFGDRI